MFAHGAGYDRNCDSAYEWYSGRLIMPLIYCETNRIAPNEFELIRSRYVGASSIDETVETFSQAENDRLMASIINIGFACKELSESESEIKVVGIESDKDRSNGGEMDILFNLLNPKDDFEARKVRSIYYEYERYLGRIQYLAQRGNIRFVLQNVNEGVRYHN